MKKKNNKKTKTNPCKDLSGANKSLRKLIPFGIFGFIRLFSVNFVDPLNSEL